MNDAIDPSGFVPAPAALSVAAILDKLERDMLEGVAREARIAERVSTAFGWTPTFDRAGGIHITKEQFAELRTMTPYDNPEPVLYRDGSSARLYGRPVFVDSSYT